MKEDIVVREKKSFSSFIIRYYDETLYVNEIIYYGDCLTDLVFNNYVKYLNNVYNRENKFLIFRSDSQKKIELEYDMIENDFNSYVDCIHIYPINIDKKLIVFIVLPSEEKIYKFCTFGNSHSSNHDDLVKFISKMSSKEW